MWLDDSYRFNVLAMGIKTRGDGLKEARLILSGWIKLYCI